MKGHYVLFAAVMVIGLGAVFLLIPGDRELAYLNLKDKVFGTALQSYEKRYAAGDLSVSVVRSLVKLRLQYADVNGAIEILERYLEKNPGSIDARHRLATLYQWAQRTGDYMRNLEEINRLQPSEESLRRLSELYSFTAQYKKQIGVLEELVKTYHAATKDLKDLATLQASLGQLADAISTLRSLERMHPQGVDRDVMSLWLSLLLDTENEEQAFKRARAWLTAHPVPAMAAQFASLFHSKRQAGLAWQLLVPFEATASKHPELLVALTQVERATGKAFQAFARLNSLYEKGRLPDNALESFIELALTQGDNKLAYEAFQGRDLSLLSGGVLTSLARAAITEKRTQAARRMLERLGKEFLNTRPVLAAELALAIGNKREMARRIAQAEGYPDLSDNQKIALANLYVRLGRTRHANRWLHRLVASESTLVSSSEDLAALYLKLGRAVEGVKLFERLRTSHPSPQVEAAWVRLATRAGKAEAVNAWLDQTTPQKISDQLLTDLYFLASDAGAATLALTFSERLYRRRGGQWERLQLAKAWVAVGQPRKALPHLRALLPDGAEVEETYVAALSAALTEGAPVTSELEHFLSRKLSEPNLTDQKREEIAYRLLNLKAYRAVLPTLLSLARRKGGPWLFDYVEAALQADQKELLIEFLKHNLDRRDLSREKKEVQLSLLLEHGGEAVALPYLRRFAETFAGAWTFAYEEALGKLGRRKALLSFWKTRASRPDTPPDEKRSIAFRMLEAGHKRSAEKVFLDLALNQSPESPDVSELLFLWGPRPDPPAIDWLEERARTASGTAKAGWLSHLVQAGASRRAIAVVDSASEPPSGRVRDAYLDALVEARDRDRLASVIDRQLTSEDNPKRLRRLARLALQENLAPTTRSAFSKLLKAKPDDPEALMWLGRLAFFDSRYAAAKRYLDRVIAFDKADYKSNFYYGDLMRRENNLTAAKNYYQRALEQISRLSSKSPRSEIVRAQLMARLGRLDDSVALFEDLLQSRVNDTDVRAEFATVLLDNGKNERAAQILSSPDQSYVPTTDPLAARRARRVTSSWPNSVKAEALAERREILLRFDRPLEEADLKDLRRLIPEFVESISSGYDSVLLRTARGAEAKVLASARELTIRWRKAPAATRQGLKTQGQLRLDLLEARLLKETGRERAALQLLDRLKDDHPQNPRVWASLADLEGRVGRWRPAYDFYRRALVLDPENEDYQEARVRVWREEARRIRMDTSFEKVEKAEEERIFRYSGHHFIDFISRFLRAGFVLEQDHVKIGNIRRADGRVESFSGSRWRGEIYLRYDTQSGSWIRGSLYPAPYGVGGGLLYARPDLAGETRLSVDFQRPNWDFVEGVVDNGTRDHLEIRRSQRLTPRLQGSLASGLNRYGIDGDTRVATSVSLNGSLRYVLRTSHPLIGIGYELDKEYRASIEERTDASGIKFNPLPLTSREIHSIDLNLSQALTPTLRVEGSGGYAFDRLGDAGPFGGLAATYEPLKRFEFQLRFQQSLNPTESTQTVRRVGASMMWRF